MMKIGGTLCATGWMVWSWAGLLQAFPENVRLGYASCRTCHVSPAGDGVLTPYGRKSSAEFLSTWVSQGESDFAYGAVKLPERLNLGGDIRAMAIAKDNRVYRSTHFFPMQADVEAALALTDSLTLAVTYGAYDLETSETRRHYLVYVPTDNLSFRAGRFYPAYGIDNGDHSLMTRRYLGFNEGEETYNFEGGVFTERGEVVLTRIFRSGLEMQNEKHTGFAARAVLYAGERSELGVSALHNDGKLWRTDSANLFFIWAWNRSLYWEAEWDALRRKRMEDDDPSVADSATLVGFTRAVWEAVRGLNLFMTYEELSPQSGTGLLARQLGLGPGVQWFIRPHFDVMGKAEYRMDETFSKGPGYSAMLLAHYYF